MTDLVAWLIECGSPPDYYCGPADWCSNPNHAHKFQTREAAQAVASTMTSMEPVRVCDHVWTDGATVTVAGEQK